MYFLKNKSTIVILSILNLFFIVHAVGQEQLAAVEDRSIVVDSQVDNKSDDLIITESAPNISKNTFINSNKTVEILSDHTTRVVQDQNVITNKESQSNNYSSLNKQQIPEQTKALITNDDEQQKINMVKSSQNKAVDNQQLLKNNQKDSRFGFLSKITGRASANQQVKNQAAQNQDEVTNKASVTDEFTVIESNGEDVAIAETSTEKLINDLQQLPLNERLLRIENIIEAQKNLHLDTKIRSLQEEIQSLRGMLEAERHKLEKSLAQQKVLYEDLDRRFSQVNSGNDITKIIGAQRYQASKETQQDLYTQAYHSIKRRDYPKAIEQFNQYLAKYPKGLFCANSNYWLGEIYMIQSEYSKALESFDRVLTDYPKSTKSGDALYKKALVYIYLKDYSKASELLNSVKQKYKNTTVARLADKKLQTIENIQNNGT